MTNDHSLGHSTDTDMSCAKCWGCKLGSDLVLALREAPNALQPMLPPALPVPSHPRWAKGTGLNCEPVHAERLCPTSLLCYRQISTNRMGFVMTQPTCSCNQVRPLRNTPTLMPTGKLCSDSGFAPSVEMLPKVKATLGNGS